MAAGFKFPEFLVVGYHCKQRWKPKEQIYGLCLKLGHLQIDGFSMLIINVPTKLVILGYSPFSNNVIDFNPPRNWMASFVTSKFPQALAQRAWIRRPGFHASDVFAMVLPLNGFWLGKSTGHGFFPWNIRTFSCKFSPIHGFTIRWRGPPLGFSGWELAPLAGWTTATGPNVSQRWAMTSYKWGVS